LTVYTHCTLLSKKGCWTSVVAVVCVDFISDCFSWFSFSFLGTSQEIGWEDRLWNNFLCRMGCETLFNVNVISMSGCVSAFFLRKTDFQTHRVFCTFIYLCIHDRTTITASYTIGNSTYTMWHTATQTTETNKEWKRKTKKSKTCRLWLWFSPSWPTVQYIRVLC